MTRATPNYANLTKVIKIVKQIYQVKDEDEGEKEEQKGKEKQLSTNFSLAINRDDYRSILTFFA